MGGCQQPHKGALLAILFPGTAIRLRCIGMPVPIDL
jgi:hypothetical protein